MSTRACCLALLLASTSAAQDLPPLTFAFPPDAWSIPNNAALVDVADVTGDGLADLVLGGAWVGSLAGHGDGTFDPAVSETVGLFMEAARSAVGDLDGDGLADLVGPKNGLFDARIASFLADGSGAFDELPGGVVPWWPSQFELDILLLDATGDGQLDAAVAHRSGLEVLVGDGSGSLLATGLSTSLGATLSGGVGPLTALDVDLDGDVDLFAEHPLSSDASGVVYTGDGAGGFTVACLLSAEDPFERGVVLADVAGDGGAEWVGCSLQSPTSGQIQVQELSACPDPSSTAGVVTPTDAGFARLLRAADLDGLLGADLIGTGIGGGEIVTMIMRSRGDGTFEPPQPLLFIGTDNLARDLDGDGLPELLWTGLNDAVLPAVLVARNTSPVPGWSDLGGALPSGGGAAAQLTGQGADVPGGLVELTLVGGEPSTNGVLVVGLAELSAPFAGGVLVPRPDLLLPWATDGAGVATLRDRWPASVTPGVQTWWQAWFDLGVQPWASNALRHLAP